MNLDEIQKLIIEKSAEIAKKHAEIMEQECKRVCERFNCNPNDLILECHPSMEFKIKINASHFKIENEFTYNGGEITSGLNSMEKLK